MSEEELRQKALQLLGRRSHSRAELEQKLRRSGSPSREIRAVLQWLQRLGYLDDTAFARQRSRFLRRRRFWGDSRIAGDLRRRGISRQLIGQVLQELRAEFPPEQALRQAQQNWSRRHGSPSSLSDLKRLHEYCRRLGFPPALIRQSLQPFFQELEG